MKKIFLNSTIQKSDINKISILKIFINNYLLNLNNYSINNKTTLELNNFIERIDIKNCNKIDKILYNSNDNKGLINIIEVFEKQNIELQQLFERIKEFCNVDNDLNYEKKENYLINYFKNFLKYLKF